MSIYVFCNLKILIRKKNVKTWETLELIKHIYNASYFFSKAKQFVSAQLLLAFLHS